MGKRRLRTVEDYERALKNGFGSGVGQCYKPWLRVVDVPSEGRSSKTQGLTVDRLHETFSDLETALLHLADFSTVVTDIREQFPLFPLDAVQAVAANAGISYPTLPGSKTPAVLTTDFVLTLDRGGSESYLAVSVKLSADLRKSRVREKLEIERIWWNALGVEWKLFTEHNISTNFIDNLISVSYPLRGTSAYQAEIDLPRLLAISGEIEARSYTFDGLLDRLAPRLEICTESARNAIFAAIWRKHLLVNLDNPILESGIIDVLGWDHSTAQALESGDAA